MKFKSLGFWKHDRCMDAFLRIRDVVPREDRTTLIADWMTQGTDGYWLGYAYAEFDVTPDEYEHWHPYVPKGDQK